MADIIGPAEQTGASEEELDRLPCTRVVLRTNARSSKLNDTAMSHSQKHLKEEMGRRGKQAPFVSPTDVNKYASCIPHYNSDRTISNNRDICITPGSTCSICLLEYIEGDSAIVLTECKHM